MMSTLDSAFKFASPRFTPIATPLASWTIHTGVLLLWIVLFAMAFRITGFWAWATGIAYIAYDTVLLVFVFWKTWRLTHSASIELAATQPALTDAPADGGGAPLTLGVIVAAHNEAKVLQVTIAALLRQEHPPEQILITDDGSSDNTAQILLQHFALAEPAVGQISAASTLAPALRWLRLPHQGKAHALNKALAHMQCDVVLTVDSDTLLEPLAVASMRNAFIQDKTLVAATGVLSPMCKPGLSGRLFQWFQTYEYIRNFLSRYAWMQVNSLLLISGAFAAFRRSALVEVGGFDTDCLVEDYELIHRMKRFSTFQNRGWTTAVVGAARARTEAPGDILAFLRQRRRWFGGFLQTQFWYRDMVGDRRHGWLGVAMLPVKAVDTLQPLYGLTAFVLLVYYLATGNVASLIPVAGIISVKIGIDLAFHLWSVSLYRRWATSAPELNGQGKLEGAYATQASFPLALLAALVEPFTFQLLRHTGAAWGWWYFLTGKKRWDKQSRVTL
ncbi:MAG: glycosyltransferase [Bdellovibrionales bacterium]|nr:glycosyltransferase [Ramlibacter sp.]